MNTTSRLAAIAIAIAALTTSACTTTAQGSAANTSQSKRTSLEADVDGALQQLSSQVPGSRELVRRARGVLVFPGVVSAGLVVGASYGQGALRKGARSAGYYSTAGGSVGLIAGAESKAIYVLFMTDDSLAKFEASKGWTAGVDASVTVLKSGADIQIDTQTAKQPIVGFALTNGGLMANLSIEGTKFTKVDL